MQKTITFLLLIIVFIPNYSSEITSINSEKNILRTEKKIRKAFQKKVGKKRAAEYPNILTVYMIELKKEYKPENMFYYSQTLDSLLYNQHSFHELTELRGKSRIFTALIYKDSDLKYFYSADWFFKIYSHHQDSFAKPLFQLKSKYHLRHFFWLGNTSISYIYAVSEDGKVFKIDLWEENGIISF